MISPLVPPHMLRPLALGAKGNESRWGWRHWDAPSNLNLILRSVLTWRFGNSIGYLVNANDKHANIWWHMCRIECTYSSFSNLLMGYSHGSSRHTKSDVHQRRGNRWGCIRGPFGVPRKMIHLLVVKRLWTANTIDITRKCGSNQRQGGLDVASKKPAYNLRS